MKSTNPMAEAREAGELIREAEAGEDEMSACVIDYFTLCRNSLKEHFS